MGYHTNLVLVKIGNVLREVEDDEIRFTRVNRIIVSASHDIYKPRGSKGHVKRQYIRKRLWSEAQERYPVLRKYIIPREISRDNRCKIKGHYALKISWTVMMISRVRDFFRKILKIFS